MQDRNRMERVFVAEGDLDLDGVKRHRAVFDELAQAEGPVVVDLRRVARIDATGLGVLVSLKRRLTESGHDMSVINPTGQPSELMHKLGVWSILRRDKARAGNRVRALDRLRPVSLTSPPPKA